MNNQPKVLRGEHAAIYQPHDSISIGRFDPVLVPVVRPSVDITDELDLFMSPEYARFLSDFAPRLWGDGHSPTIWTIKTGPYGKEKTLEDVTSLSSDERNARVKVLYDAAVEKFKQENL